MARTLKRRQQVRVEVPGTLLGTIGLRHAVQVINLSPTGAMIEHPSYLAPGEACVLSLELLGVELRLWAHVVWSHVTKISIAASEGGRMRFRSGLHFRELPAPAEACLQEYLPSLSSPTAVLRHSSD